MSERRVRVYIGLGANVGAVRATLTDAVVALAGLPGTRLRGVSRLYATDPVGVTDQAEFHNAAVALDVPAGTGQEAGAIALLVALKDLERRSGRQPRRRWGPRELDLDLLVFGRARLVVERPSEAASNDAPSDPAKAPTFLVVPHAEARERLFVLAPLADLAPGLVPPGWDSTVETARRRQAVFEALDAVRAIGAWDPVSRTWRPVEAYRSPRVG